MKYTVTLLGALGLGPLAALQAADAVPTLITVHENQPGALIPASFIGLSYEKSAIAQKHFRADNVQLVNLHRNLGSGVIRVGGNKVELCSWRCDETQAASGKGGYAVTPSCLDDFYEFAKAIDWRVIHGVNLASNQPEMSADEIKYALSVDGKSIMAFEVGNEPDHYDKDTKKLRAKGYSFALYKSELEAAQRIFLARNPGAKLVGPATTSGDAAWFEPFAADFKSTSPFFTSHFYPLSAKSNPPPTAESLLSAAAKSKTVAMVDKHVGIAREAGVPYRLAECNSASMGGTDGVSDTFAAAVWGVDFLFDVAEHGAVGVHLHTIFGTRGYTAIGYDKTDYVARPLYYALLLFKDAGRGKSLKTETQTDSNVTSHATLTDDGKLRVTIINKSVTAASTATVVTDHQRSTATLARLSAAAPTSKAEITYSGASVQSDGQWTARPPETIHGKAGRFEVILPACSAAVITLESEK